MDDKKLIPATSTIMVDWTVEVLREKGPITRDDLLKAVEVIAGQKGFYVRDILKLKKTLMIAKEQGLVSSPRKSWWTAVGRRGASDLAVMEKPEALKQGRQQLNVVREVGTGSEAIYVICFKEDIEQAARDGQPRYPCKIGKSTDARSRLLSDPTTYQHHTPIVGLVINCANCSQLEKVFHGTFKIAGTWKTNEWFITTPAMIEQFYRDWLRILQPLI